MLVISAAFKVASFVMMARAKLETEREQQLEDAMSRLQVKDRELEESKKNLAAKDKSPWIELTRFVGVPNDPREFSNDDKRRFYRHWNVVKKAGWVRKMESGTWVYTSNNARRYSLVQFGVVDRSQSRLSFS